MSQYTRSLPCTRPNIGHFLSINRMEIIFKIKHGCQYYDYYYSYVCHGLKQEHLISWSVLKQYIFQMLIIFALRPYLVRYWLIRVVQSGRLSSVVDIYICPFNQEWLSTPALQCSHHACGVAKIVDFTDNFPLPFPAFSSLWFPCWLNV